MYVYMIYVCCDICMYILGSVITLNPDWTKCIGITGDHLMAPLKPLGSIVL